MGDCGLQSFCFRFFISRLLIVISRKSAENRLFPARRHNVVRAAVPNSFWLAVALRAYKGPSDWPNRPEACWEVMLLRTMQKSKTYSPVCTGWTAWIGSNLGLWVEHDLKPQVSIWQTAPFSSMCYGLMWKTHWALTVVRLLFNPPQLLLLLPAGGWAAKFKFEPMCHQISCLLTNPNWPK